MPKFSSTQCDPNILGILQFVYDIDKKVQNLYRSTLLVVKLVMKEIVVAESMMTMVVAAATW